MNTKKDYSKYSKVEDYLKDDTFVRYVLDDAPDAVRYWNGCLQEHAGLLNVFREAVEVLSAMSMEEPDLGDVEIEQLKRRILASLEIENVSY